METELTVSEFIGGFNGQIGSLWCSIWAR